MPEWINVNKSTPDEYGEYYCKVHGRKQILPKEKIDEYVDRYDDIFWLDETASSISQPQIKGRQPYIPSNKSIIQQPVIANKVDILNIHMKQLVNFFGKRKAQGIADRISEIDKAENSNQL